MSIRALAIDEFGLICNTNRPYLRGDFLVPVCVSGRALRVKNTLPARGGSMRGRGEWALEELNGYLVVSVLVKQDEITRARAQASLPRGAISMSKISE